MSPAPLPIALAAVLALIGGALVILFLPPVVHAALAVSDAATWLGVDGATAAGWSDTAIAGIVTWRDPLGPVLAAGPLFTSDEEAHLRDARLLAWAAWVAGALSLAGLLAWGRDPGRRAAMGPVLRRTGLAVIGVTVTIGIVGLVAFEPLFELFHRIAFPGGNWAFDASFSRLVRLYPLAFWEVMAAALGVLIVVGGLCLVLIGRRIARPA